MVRSIILGASQHNVLIIIDSDVSMTSGNRQSDATGKSYTLILICMFLFGYKPSDVAWWKL